MKRLPEYLYALSPVGETLASVDGEMAHLQESAAERNLQISVATASEDGLARWEKDLGLPSSGNVEERRARILTALLGGRTLTPAQLHELAITVGGADRSRVEEDFPGHHVTLYAIGEGRMPENVGALKEAVERLRPEHLTLNVQVYAGAESGLCRYAALTGRQLLHLRMTCAAAGEETEQEET